MTEGPLFSYRAHCRAGRLKSDPLQALASEKLQSLYRAVSDYRPASGSAGWRERLGLGRRQRETAPQGLYLFGPVGRGKSMLMDMFFDSVPVDEKRRVHFHEFMIEIHAALHEIRGRGGARDPLGIVADNIASRTWLLCFDEFQVENIADAMILGRLFQGLFKAGAVVVATSNTRPTDLYKGKLQYDRFVPFIDLLCERLDVLELAGAVDYRRESLRAMQLYHTPLDPAAEAALDSAFLRLTADAPAAPEQLMVQGRNLDVPLTAKWGRKVFVRKSVRGAARCGGLSRHRQAVPYDHPIRHSPLAAGAAQRIEALPHADRCALRAQREPGVLRCCGGRCNLSRRRRRGRVRACRVATA